MNPLALAKRTLWGKQPLQVILFVTARCNLRCDVCFYWQEIENAQNRGELSLAEIQTLSSSMQPFPWLLIGGGEPMLRGDLAKVVSTFVNGNGVTHVSVPTNGYYTEKLVKFVEDLFKSAPKVKLNIDLSIHELGAAHDRIVGVDGAFERLKASHQELRCLQQRYPNLGLGSVVAMSRSNQARWREILTWVIDELGIDSLALAKARGKPKDPALVDVDTAQYRAAADYIHAAHAAKKLPGFAGFSGAVAVAKDHLVHREIETMLRGGGYVRPCQAGRLSAVIDECGTVYPCELLDRPLGTLRDVGMDFQQIWRGAKADEARGWIHETKCHCTHECFQSVNLLSDPRTAAKIGLKATRAHLNI